MKIAIAGNPNCGKTTLFNRITNSNQHIGNWPGVTVEKKEGYLQNDKEISVIDLPGIYSLSTYTPEEIIARNYILENTLDCIINVVDASNLERNLYFTTQLLDLEVPVIIALNMIDILNEKNIKFNIQNLENDLGVKVIPISSLKGYGIDELIRTCKEFDLNKTKSEKLFVYLDSYLSEKAIEIRDNISSIFSKSLNFYTIKLLEGDTYFLNNISSSLKSNILDIHCNIRDIYDDDCESVIISKRYDYVEKLSQSFFEKPEKIKDLSFSNKLDNILTHKFFSIPIFALIIFLVYYLSIYAVGGVVTDWVNDELFGTIIPDMATSFFENINTPEWLKSLIIDGIIAGVGSVLGFLPQMIVLFFFLGILEDCGYMARIAFIMDRIFRKFGLSGKSVIPILISSGCAVPGIMSCRTIENNLDRRVTIMVSSFIPCSAKLPVIALICGSMFSYNVFIGPFTYFIGIFAILISGIILKKIFNSNDDTSPFVMEMPKYHLPYFNTILINIFDRSISFIKKAGTVILAASIVVWFFSYFDFYLRPVTEINNSILAGIGSLIAPVFSPLGFDSWQSTVATFNGIIAKENVASTFSVIFGFSDIENNLLFNELRNHFTTISAYSFLIFNLLCAPCIAAIGAIKREMNNRFWTTFAIFYQTTFAYICSFIFYQISYFIINKSFNILTLIAFVIIISFIYIFFALDNEGNNK